MQCFILAGGFATRLWPLTERRAKPLLPLAGKPIIDHLLEQIPKDLSIIVSTNAAYAKDFQQWKGGHTDRNISVVVEHTTHEDQKLGALGAVAQWIREYDIADDVLLLTGDNYCGFSFENFLKNYTPGTPLLAAFDIQNKEEAKHFGTVIVAEDGKTVRAFEEKPNDPRTSLVSTGCSVLPKNTLSVLQEYAIKHPDNVGGIFEEFLRQQIPVECFVFTEPWFDIGSFDAYLAATQMLVGKNVIRGKDSIVDAETRCTGSVVIGNRSSVHKSMLTNVVLFEDCVIENCVIENCVIDKSCVLRGIDLTGKMLREGTVLERKQ